MQAHTSDGYINTMHTAKDKYYSMMNMDIFEDTFQINSQSSSDYCLTISSSEQSDFLMKDTDVFKISKLTLILMCFLLIGFSLTTIGTIFSVHDEASELKISRILSTDKEDENPVTFIATKFKVPATNTFNVFKTGPRNEENEENEKRRIKFANTLETDSY